MAAPVRGTIYLLTSLRLILGMRECGNNPYLQSIILDKLLESVHNIEALVVILVTNVTSVQPTIIINGGSCCSRITKVTFHYHGTFEAEFTFVVGAQRFASF